MDEPNIYVAAAGLAEWGEIPAVSVLYDGDTIHLALCAFQVFEGNEWLAHHKDDRMRAMFALHLIEETRQRMQRALDGGPGFGQG